jgi:hypothetical protein
MSKLKRLVQNQIGAALALVALTMIVMLGMVALAVDVGMLMAARTEAQTLADASALAGASSLIDTPGDEAAARARAIEWAVENTVAGENVTVLPEDVDVLLDEWKVRVRVFRNEARGNAVPTFFGRVLGIDRVGIVVNAAAEAAPANTAGGDPTAACLLPVALIDDFDDMDGDGDYTAGDYYNPAGGYTSDDHGKLIKLKIQSTTGEGPPECRTDGQTTETWEMSEIDYCQDGGESSSWRCWWREDPPDDGGGGGTSVLGPRIYPATDCGPALTIGDDIWAASGSGNKQSLVNGVDTDNSFADLIESDLDKFWCPDCAEGGAGCVAEESNPEECFTGDSGRVREAPVIDPTTIGDTGSNTSATVVDFIGTFVERVSCSYDAGQFGGPDGRWNVYIRLIVESGSGGSSDDVENTSTLLRTLRLVE